MVRLVAAARNDTWHVESVSAKLPSRRRLRRSARKMRSTGKLHIVRATYGSGATDRPDRDCTAEVRKLIVQDRQIFVTNGIHTKLGDHELGVNKTFRVVYKDLESPWKQEGLFPGGRYQVGIVLCRYANAPMRQWTKQTRYAQPQPRSRPWPRLRQPRPRQPSCPPLAN